jgi:DEAD/DEAH box helicase domain-containing protein
MLDYFVRMGNHIQPLIDGERKYIRDANLSTPIAGPNDSNKSANHWPSLKLKDDGIISRSQSRMIVLLCAGLGIETYDEFQKQSKVVQDILNDAWTQLVEKRILKAVSIDDSEGYNNPIFYSDNKFVGCYYLDMSAKQSNKTVYLKKTEKVRMCPVTGRLLDTTFCRYSPLIGGEISKRLFDKYHCNEKPILMPERPSENDNVDSWLQTDDKVRRLKESGLWSDRHKYAYKKYPAYIAAEHSAQQSKSILKKYTKAFSQDNPSINVLHCSTTMEMGVDIGDIDVVLMDTIPPTAANYLQRVGRAGRTGQSKALAFSLCNNTPIGQFAFANPMWALQTTNHMIKVRESQTIIQRHINSFFFRQFICGNGTGIPANVSVDEFMSNIYDNFIDFLDRMSTNASEKKLFEEVFGDKRFTIDITRQQIISIHDQYKSVINELEDVFVKYTDDERRKMAVSNQIKKCKKESLLNYLSDNQFIPNANMPTGVVIFDFTDRDQALKLHKLYEQADKLRNQKETANSESEKYDIEQKLSKAMKEITEIRRDTSASRDIHTALNEYAPEQTVVVNEKNYFSAGIILFGAYNDSTQTKGIYHCTHCGHTEYSDNLDENKTCPVCGNPYHGIVDSDNTSYTRAYEPIGFRTDQSIESTREEKTDKRYYDIRPVLLKTDWTHSSKLNLCEVINSGDNGSILFYNVGSGYGFAFCKRCGRSSIEYCKDNSEKTIPGAVKPGHNRLWGDPCDANNNDIARHVVFTGRHQTCYSVLRFKKSMDSNEYENDEQLAYSLGVIITRALAKSEGIDEGEIDFGIKQEQEGWVLFIYDTAKGGCGYSLKLANPNDCQDVLNLAKIELENSPCNCEENGGACAKCLIDRNNYRNSNKLSKAKALDWLIRQSKKTISVPVNVLSLSSEAKVAYQSLKSIALQAINSQDVSAITFCVSDNTSDYSVNDWSSIRSEMGKLLTRAIENGKNVSIKIEYHPNYHMSLVDKLPFIDLQSKFPDCNVELVNDMGLIKTALIIETSDNTKRYFTTQIDALSFSNNWGTNCDYLFVDHKDVQFRKEANPTYTVSLKEIVREGLSPVSTFLIGKYFSQVIAPGVLKSDDIDVLSSILKDNSVDITFSDMYVNSALSSLMLVYLVKEMRDLFGFEIENITLQLDSPRRKCSNERFNGYTHISLNFDNKENADKYTDDLIMKILGVDAEHSFVEADHYRWLKITTEKGDIVEIRPDHGISGGWRSDSSYMNLNNLDGTVRVYKTNEDILYYIIIRKNSL